MAEYDDTDQLYADPEVSPYDDSDVMSPMQALLGGAFGTVTPEGKAQASKIFGELYQGRGKYHDSEQAAYDDYEAQAQQAREVLRKAREVLAAKKVPSTRWLEMAQGFGRPTRTGAFGESLSNYATARIPGRQQEAAWDQARDQQLLGFDTGMSTIDQQLALQRLKLLQAQRGADDKLMTEAMKLMGKPTPLAGQNQTPASMAEKDLNRAYIKDYVSFIQNDAPNASADIAALEAAQNALTGVHLDKNGQPVQGKPSDTLSGPIVGLVPKIMRDVILPKSSETQENVESVAQKSMRVIMGPQFTEGEGLRLLARVYNPRFEEDVNARRVGRLLKQLKTAYNEKVRAARYFETNGTMKGYKGRKVWTMSMFDPDIPVGKSPLDAAMDEAGAVLGGDKPARPAAAAAPEPDEGQEEIDINSLMPAHARGGRIKKYAEGGIVKGNFPDGRPRFQMPDGKIIRANPGQTYDEVLQIYTTATGRAPTRPGLPPQEIPARDDVPAEQDDDDIVDPVAPAAAAAPPDDQSVLPDLAQGAGESLAGAGAAVAANAVANRLPGIRASTPEKRVIDMMAERRLTPQMLAAQVRGLQRQGVPAMALDVGDPAVRALAESSLQESGGPNATEMLRRLRDRAAGQHERTSDQINTALKPDPYFEQLDKLHDNLYTNAAPLYEAAYKAHPAMQTQVLGELLSTPDGKKAVKNALRIMRNEGKKIGAADVTGMVRSPSLEFLDYVKRGLDQSIVTEEGSGANYKATPLGKSMRELRTKLVTELDTSTTDKKGKSLYAEARAQYAGDLEVLDALETGRSDYLKMAPDEAARKVKKMSFAEKDALRTGVAQGLFERIGTPSTDVNAARKVIGSPEMRKRLRPLFDNDKQYQLFETALTKEMELHDASKSTIAAGERGLAKHVGPQPNLFQRAASKAPRLGLASPIMWAMQLIRNTAKTDEKQFDAALKHLKAATPEELMDLEKFQGKFNRRVNRRGRAGKAAAVGAVLGAGAKAYEMATEDEDDAE